MSDQQAAKIDGDRTEANRAPRAEEQSASRTWLRLAPVVTALLAAAILSVAVFAAYRAGLHAPFVFDDKPGLAENPSILHVYPLWGAEPGSGPLWPAPDLPTSGRPLVNLSFALNVAYGGLDPFGFHVVNVCLHVLAALVLFALARRTLRLERFEHRFDRAADGLALAAALLWALHPINTETVEYVTQRTELMVGLFYLLTLYGALRYWTAGDEPARVGWLLFATTACLAGMASKEVMVTAPVVVLLFERAFVAGSLRQALRQSWPLYVGLALGWTLLFALNRAGPRTASAGFQLGAAVRVSPWIYWCTEAKVLFLYLKLAVWPWPLVIHYDMTFINAFATAWPWVLPAVLLALASLYLWWRNTATGFVAAALWIILSPTLVVPVLSEVAAERRMYLPMAAVCALVVAGGYSVLGRIWPRRTTAAARGSNGPGRGAVVAATVAVVVIAATFAALDVKRMTAYESEIGLWEDTLRNQPHNALALTSLGISLMHAGRNEEAIERLTEAVQYAFFGISEAQFRVKLAMALAGVDRVDEAIFEYREALRLGFNNPAEIHLSIGVLLLGADRGEEGLRELEEALRLKPDSPQVHSYLGLALLQLGRSREAATRLKHAVRLAPGSADAHYNLGRALAKDKELRQAIEEFQEALRLQPDFPAATKALAHALVDSQQSAAAVGLLRKAVEAEPENGELRYAFGRALAGAGRLPDAIVQFQSAEQHGERTGALYRAYGHALLQLRRPGEAAARLELAASLDPNDAETLFAAAKARAQAQQPEQAVAAAERALDLARTNGLTDLAAEIDAWLIEFRRHPFSP